MMVTAGQKRVQISIRAPARGATLRSSVVNRSRLFQSALPRGERQGRSAAMLALYKFQSALPRGERRSASASLPVAYIFQSALPRGERLLNFWIGVIPIDFNPRSREGSDEADSGFQLLLGISIRAPARGATLYKYFRYHRWNISIRAPARGATRYRIIQDHQFQISIRAPARGATSIFAKKFSSLLAKIV